MKSQRPTHEPRIRAMCSDQHHQCRHQHAPRPPSLDLDVSAGSSQTCDAEPSLHCRLLRAVFVIRAQAAFGCPPASARSDPECVGRPRTPVSVSAPTAANSARPKLVACRRPSPDAAYSLVRALPGSVAVPAASFGLPRPAGVAGWSRAIVGEPPASAT
jgi:hypothetical protein